MSKVGLASLTETSPESLLEIWDCVVMVVVMVVVVVMVIVAVVVVDAVMLPRARLISTGQDCAARYALMIVSSVYTSSRVLYKILRNTTLLTRPRGLAITHSPWLRSYALEEDRNSQHQVVAIYGYFWREGKLRVYLSQLPKIILNSSYVMHDRLQ